MKKIFEKLFGKKPVEAPVNMPVGDGFKLRIVPRWPDSEFVTFQYSMDTGQTWNNIYWAEEPFLDMPLKYDWKWKPVYYEIGERASCFDTQKRQFSSLEKIKEFENYQRTRLEEGMKEVQRLREAHKERQKSILQDLNKDIL